MTAGCATAVNPSSGDAGAAVSNDAGATKDSGGKKLDAGSPTPDSGSTTTVEAGGPPPDDSTCAGEGTRNDCEQCCLLVHPSGYGVYHAELTTCACSSPGACATECATELCASAATTPGGACETCITASLTQGSGACYDGVSNACQADVDCSALFTTCIPPCEGK